MRNSEFLGPIDLLTFVVIYFSAIFGQTLIMKPLKGVRENLQSLILTGPETMKVNTFIVSFLKE